jgi:hypothetical protein
VTCCKERWFVLQKSFTVTSPFQQNLCHASDRGIGLLLLPVLSLAAQQPTTTAKPPYQQALDRATISTTLKGVHCIEIDLDNVDGEESERKKK